MEIERKFKVERLPQGLESCSRSHIQQAYLCREPVVRVRRRDDSFWLTCKGKGLLSREEFELPLCEEAYQYLLNKADGNIITKDRWCIPYRAYTIELDVFKGALAPLMLAEVEFSTEEEAEAFCPPDWFGEEVTYDPTYCNSNLSRERTTDPIRPGRYRHFKGNEYEVLYTATHSETMEPMVVYRALYGERGLWVRPASMWEETVVRDGREYQRFMYIGDQLKRL